jgi:gliding-associated putative ABC transporter substrate-binding component GldG
MATRKTFDNTVLSGAIIGSLVLVNVIGVGLFGRLDLTRDREFTLSGATRSTLKDLSDPVTVRAYFTKDLPAPYSANARYVRDLLEEYYAAAHHNLHYEMTDPTSEETDADAAKKKEVSHDIFGRAIRDETSVEKQLRELGIPPVQVQVNEGDKVETKRAYMGISVSYGDKHEVIPLVKDTAGLEYDLTTAIRKLTRDKSHKIAFVTGHDGPDPHKELSRFTGVLGQLDEVSTLDLTSKPEIPDDVNALVVVAPKTPLSETELRAIDKFAASGRSVAFLLGAIIPDLKKLSSTPIDSGLAPLLGAWGVHLDPGLVLDPECATINVSRQQGFMQISQPMSYPFLLQPKSLSAHHPLTHGLSGVAFPFMSEVSVSAPSGSEIKTDTIVSSSSKSWIQSAPFDLDPFQRWTDTGMTNQGEKGLLVTLEGQLPSPFGQTATGKARVLVAGGYSFVTDDFLSKGNEALALNLVDWLMQDDALLAVRTRGLTAAPLSDTMSDGTRNAIKFANILGLPLLLVVFGIVRWRVREGRRTRIVL